VFTHYLAEIAISDEERRTVGEWNRVVEAVDVEALAAQAAQVGAGYYFMTMGQNSGYFLAPNPVYDEFVGRVPSRCAERDLIADLAAALRRRGIPLLVYLPSGAPDRDEVAGAALEWQAGDWNRKWDRDCCPRLESFQRKWEAVIAEWSRRWGEQVRGWWFDGCYYTVAMYDYPEAPNWESFAGAARAGNPEAILAFNPGVYADLPGLTPHQDYTAGEINDEFPPCAGRWLRGLQWHVLTYLGPTWGQSPPRLSPAQVADYTAQALAHGGTVTWDLPPLPSGRLPEEFLACLTEMPRRAH
jgi:hypothetical protein